jgi:hypothetical protein
MELRVAKILWASILGSVLILFFLSDLIPKVVSEDRKVLNWIFTFASIGLGLGALTIGSKIKIKDGRLPISYLFQLILIEVIAVFGLILKVLGASFQEAGIYFLISFIGLIFMKPKVS